MAYDVFLSYRHRDAREAAARLAQLLAERGVRVYLDQQEIDPGTTISRSVESALTSTRLFVAWYSKGYLDSEACCLELARVLVASAEASELPIFIVNPERGDSHIKPVWLGGIRRYDLGSGSIEGLVEALVRQAAVAELHGAPPAKVKRYGSYPSARTHWLAGRNPLIFEIFDAFHAQEQPDTSRRLRPLDVVVTGPPGIGKSNLVQRYEALFGSRYPGGAYWFEWDGSNGEEGAASRWLEQRLALALERGWIGGQAIEGAGPAVIENCVDSAIRRALGNEASYLWIVENVSEHALAQGNWRPPSANGLALATGVMAAADTEVRTVALDALSPEAMRETLAAGLGASCPEDQLDRLERATAGYPGRLAAILAEVRAFGIDVVLAHYEADSPLAAGYAAAYRPLLDSLDAQTRACLDALAALLPTAIPAPVASNLAGGGENASHALSNLKRLRELALVRALGDGAIAIERPVRNLLGEPNTAAREAAASALAAAMPSTTRTRLTGQLVQLAAHARHLTVTVDSEAVALLLMRLGAHHALIGDKDAERDAFERSHAWLDRHLGRGNAQTVEALRGLALSWRNTPREAELFARALDALDPAPSLMRAELLHGLAIARERSVEKAVELSDQAILMLDQLPDDETTRRRRMLMMNSRGIWFREMGRGEEAAACFEASWQAAQTLPEEDGDRLRCIATFAAVTLQSSPQRSLDLMVENLAIARRLYGRRHHLVSWAACDLFTTAYKCGLIGTAREVFLRDLVWLFKAPRRELNDINRSMCDNIASGTIDEMRNYRKYRAFTTPLRDRDASGDLMELLLMVACLMEAPADHPDFAMLMAAYLRAPGRRRDRSKRRMAMRWERNLPRFVSIDQNPHVQRCARAIRRFRRGQRVRGALRSVGALFFGRNRRSPV